MWAVLDTSRATAHVVAADAVGNVSGAVDAARGGGALVAHTLPKLAIQSRHAGATCVSKATGSRQT